MPDACLPLDLPAWAAPYDDRGIVIADDEGRMRYAIELARQNVEHRTGGPFGAAIFDQTSGRLLAIGVNSVLRLNSSVLHAEMMAIMRAQRTAGSYTLRPADGALYASCEPCAMCLGGILWSGVRRLVCGAPAAIARAAGFDEGPVGPDAYRYLEGAGIEVRRGLMAAEAGAVIQHYQALGGPIYNA